MRARLIAAGTRLPAWLTAGFQEYVQRLPKATPLTLTEIALSRRRSQQTHSAIDDEGERMLAHIQRTDYVVALEVSGRACSSEELARWWAKRLAAGRDLVFLIGGPDGLAKSCLARSDERLSLSALTLPHGLVRVLLAEQLYRATSLLAGHPYHRA
jgi:23S rRNA (pseudouridine1915-N3)-methyltransferase